MRRRRTTITEEYSPTFRRRISNNYLNLSMPGFLPDEDLSLDDNEEETGNYNITQFQSAEKTQVTLKKAMENFQNFITNHEKVQTIIDKVDEFIRRRMQAHEIELITVVRSEIDRITEDSKRIVEQYNQMIEAKNKETEIYSLQNQVAYFKHQAQHLFEDNKVLRTENKQLKIILKTKDSIIDELNEALKKAAKRLMRQKKISTLAQREEFEVKRMQYKERKAQSVKNISLQSQAIITEIENQQQLVRTKSEVKNQNNKSENKKTLTTEKVTEIPKTPRIQNLLSKETRLNVGGMSHRYKKTTSTKIPTNSFKKRLKTQTNLSQYDILISDENGNQVKSKRCVTNLFANEKDEGEDKQRSFGKGFWRYEGIQNKK